MVAGRHDVGLEPRLIFHGVAPHTIKFSGFVVPNPGIRLLGYENVGLIGENWKRTCRMAQMADGLCRAEMTPKAMCST